MLCLVEFHADAAVVVVFLFFGVIVVGRAVRVVGGGGYLFLGEGKSSEFNVRGQNIMLAHCGGGERKPSGGCLLP